MTTAPSATFSEPVDQASIVMTLTNGATTVPATLSYSAATERAVATDLDRIALGVGDLPDAGVRQCPARRDRAGRAGARHGRATLRLRCRARLSIPQPHGNGLVELPATAELPHMLVRAGRPGCL